jgi:O-antigen ligase
VQAPSATTLMPHPHNIYLHTLLTLGLPGAGLLFFLVFTGFRNAWNNRHPTDPTLSAWQTACLAGLVGFSFYGLVDSSLYAGRVTALTGWVLALLFARSTHSDDLKD